MVAAVFALSAAVTFFLIKRVSIAEVATLPAGRAATSAAASDAAAIAESGPAPTWVGRQRAAWASDGSKTIAFELQATRDVPVWMTRVRPVLVARCASRRTEVFVVMGTAASIEPQHDSHTIRLRVDDDPEELQQWAGSESQQELFAPDGPLLVRRLAHAHRLRVGFRPYNVPSVTAEFTVDGFDRLAGLVAGTCGWRLEGPAPDAQRVSLKRP